MLGSPCAPCADEASEGVVSESEDLRTENVGSLQLESVLSVCLVVSSLIVSACPQKPAV